ncbi:MAG: putative aminohydrolase SsnA [Synergistaceae bacterium]|jgi:putative selenium metabolism protein SsnA|nr:putative aminohydrolase SsnA [Synergistaceae bacterium]MDD3916642.1 putative aminohydrolase SsnA [Synergistaceae bacterium]HOO86799.1 putative aminohydrolase SsnA [Synergistales bacterium]HRV98454.1 putative aminohydrolase SsnA [Aminobacteriaceae bacterium]
MLLIGNGKVITRDENNTVIENGAVVIDGAHIKAVGKTEDLKKAYPGATFKDAKGRLVMPGLINVHMHYYSTFARGIALDSPPATKFSEILEGLWWRLDKCLTLEDVYYSVMGPGIDQIKCGVTSVIDHHASPFAVRGSLAKIAEASAELGLRSNLCYEVSDRDGEQSRVDGITENIEFIKACAAKKDDMLKGMFGLHASMTISDKTLNESVEQMAGLDAGFHVHVAEGIEDLEDSKAKYGLGVVERWHKHGVLGPKSLAIHCIHISEKEMDLLKESDVAVAHNPESNMGNAVGLSPVLPMMKKGVLVGLGTDGYTADMFESYKVANCLHKHGAKLPSVAWTEPPTMLFENNKKIMNRQIDGEVGTLKPGAYADVVIVDYDPPTPLHGGNINGHLLFGVCGRHVSTTIANGKVLMDERKLVHVDEEKIMAESRALAKKLWERI